jgi:SAM-dependent methyltransferase
LSELGVRSDGVYAADAVVLPDPAHTRGGGGGLVEPGSVDDDADIAAITGGSSVRTATVLGQDLRVKMPTHVVAKRDNAYIDMARNLSKTPVRPPQALLDRLTGVVRGRHVGRIREHWQDMSAGVFRRNQDLVQSLRRQPGAKEDDVARLRRRKKLDAASAPGTAPRLLYGPEETVAYSLHRTVPNFTTATAVFEDVAASLPGWQPRTMLDVGSGTGSAVWAAHEVWPLAPLSAVAIEPSRSMRQVAEHLLQDKPGVVWRSSLEELARLNRGRQFDLVVAANTLTELGNESERVRVTSQMWSLVSPGGVLVLVERGTRWGFHVIKTMRDGLLARAANKRRLQLQREMDRDPTEHGDSARGGQGVAEEAEAFDDDAEAAMWDKAGVDMESWVQADPSAAATETEAEAETAPPATAGDTDAGAAEQAEAESSDADAVPGGIWSPPAATNTLPLVTSPTDAPPVRLSRALAAPPVPPAPPGAFPLTSPGTQGSARAAVLAGVQPAGGGLRVGTSGVPVWISARRQRQKSKRDMSHDERLVARLAKHRGPLDSIGAAVVGPCPHALACPMHAKSWCSFGQASFNHRLATKRRKQSPTALPTLEERFSYFALRKTTPATEADHAPHVRAGWAQAEAAREWLASTMADEQSADAAAGRGPVTPGVRQ